jgi:hypothetical protein
MVKVENVKVENEGQFIRASDLEPSERARWNPKVRRLYDYWASLHPERGLPGRQHLDPTAIPQLLSNLLLLDVQHEPYRLKYRLVGTRIVARLGHEVTGRWLDEIHPQWHDEPEHFEGLRQVVEEQMPVWRRGPPLIRKDSQVAEVEQLVLPLARNGETVDILLAISIGYRIDGDEL